MLPLILKNSDYPWSPWSLLEFLAASGRKEGKEHSFIRNRDIVLAKDGLKITLWKTKTDNKNIGVNKFIAPKRLPYQPLQPCQSAQDRQKIGSEARRPLLRHTQWKTYIKGFTCKIYSKHYEKDLSRHTQLELERDFPKERRSHICHEGRN